jgi:hypothetical protein
MSLKISVALVVETEIPTEAKAKGQAKIFLHVEKSMIILHFKYFQITKFLNNP